MPLRVGADRELPVAEVAGIAALDALRGEWEALYGAVPDATPFQSPSWVMAWWRHLGRGEPRTLVVRDGAGLLVGVVPLAVAPDAGQGDRVLLFAGTGVTDYLDPLLAPAMALEAAAGAVRYLAAAAGGWDRVELHDLPAGSAFLAAARAAVPGAVHPLAVCPAVTLPAAAEAYLAGFSQRRRAKLRRAERALASAGAVVHRADASTAAGFLDDLFALHAARWGERGEAGVLGNPAVQAFHREVAPALAGAGELRLYRLRAPEATIAVLYAVARGPRAYYYVGGFDPAFEALSPGAVLVGHAVAAAIGEGRAAFDFLRGREPYKYQWGAEDEPTYRVAWGAAPR